MTEIQIIQGIEGYEKNGFVYLRLETVARGLGFTTTANSGKEVVRWQRVFQYLSELGVVATSGNGEDSSYQDKCPEFIPENIFYRLAMKAKNNVAEAFQAKVADEIIPTLRKTGTYTVGSNQAILPNGVLDGAERIFKLAGLERNQLTLAMDKIVKHYTGISMLAIGKVQLKVSEQTQLLTPTEIGAEIGLSGRAVNALLLGMKYQQKAGKGYEPIGEGKMYGVMLDVGKKHGNGTPIRQLKWDSSIVNIMKGKSYGN